MPYNLLHEPWIPVRRKSGRTEWVQPCQITEQDDPPLALNAPRPDFNGALIQFLIGLIQTAFAPTTEREWRRRFKSPPTPEELQNAFLRYEHAFNLNGDGPRFMQDWDKLEGVEEKKIQLLIMDGPSENAVTENRDHFVRNYRRDRGRDMLLSAECAATALLVYQLNVASTAAGNKFRHHSTLRGPGPVTTIILGDNLWQTLWLNVVPSDDVEALGATREHDADSDIFPWLSPTRSGEHGQETTREDIHPLQMYWPMPRRIELTVCEVPGDCAILAGRVEKPIQGFRTLREGVNYRSPWSHPLSPSKGWNAVKVDTGQFGYQHWTRFVALSGDCQPALPVRRFWAKAPHGYKGSLPRLWVFGFDYEPGKANLQAYRESTMPLLVVQPEHREDFERFAAALVLAADLLADSLKKALKKAEADSAVADTAIRFWQNTESVFYDLLEQAREQLDSNDAEWSSLLTLRKEWLAKLRRHLIRLFNEVTQYGAFRASDPKAQALAYADLMKAASQSNKRIQQVLDLPKPKKKAP